MPIEGKQQASKAPILVGITTFFIEIYRSNALWQSIGLALFLAFIAWYADNAPDVDDRHW